MKRILSILIVGALAMGMCAAMTGCGRDRSKNTSSSVTSTIKATKPSNPVATTSPVSGSDTQSTTIAVNPDDLSSIKPNPRYSNPDGAFLEDAALEESGRVDEDGYFAQVYGSYKHDGNLYFAVVIFDKKDKFDSLWWVSEDGNEVIDNDTFFKDYIAPDYGVSNGGSVPSYYIDSTIAPKSDSSDKSSDSDDSDSDDGGSSDDSNKSSDKSDDGDSDDGDNDNDNDNDGGDNDGGDSDGGDSDGDYNEVEAYDGD